MKGQHCRLLCPIVLLLSGVCVVYGYEDTCKFVENYKCTVNVSTRYGFNIYHPDIMDQVPILNNTEFVELCSDFLSMASCLQVNKPCDHRSKRYTRYAYALANALDYACRKNVLEGYDSVVNCLQRTDVQSARQSCHETLRRNIQLLVNKMVESALTSRVDMTVVVEKACQHLIISMDCTTKALLHSCSSFVNDWYHNVFTEMIKPTLQDYRCQLYMPVSKIIILFFVFLAAVIVAVVVVYLCVQRYKSFMRSRMNFVLSVIPKAQHTLRKFDPRISQSVRTSKTTGEVPSTEPQTPPPPDASTVSQAPPTDSTQPPPIDPTTAHVLEELSKASKDQPSSWKGWFT